MSRLFEVEITIRGVVQADDVTHAYEVARNSASEMSRDDSFGEIDIGRDILELKHLPTGWDGECLPYGGDGSTRINAILDAMTTLDANTIDMFKAQP